MLTYLPFPPRRTSHLHMPQDSEAATNLFAFAALAPVVST